MGRLKIRIAGWLPPGIAAKTFLLFLVLAVSWGASGWSHHRAMARVDGAALSVNLYGTLRYLGQNILVGTYASVLAGAPAEPVERLIAEFEKNLLLLERSRAAGPLGEEARRLLIPVRSEWGEYRAEIREILRRRDTLVDSRGELLKVSGSGERLLDRANDATWQLSRDITDFQERARVEVLGLTVLNAGILLLVLIFVRRRIVRPLQRLADVGRRFADGEHGVRSGFRSHDEIGRLASALDRMADEAQRHIEVIANDLEEIRQKEAELRKLGQAIEYSPASVVVTGPDGVIEYVNPAFTRITGYTREEAIGRTPSILKSDQTNPETYRQLWQTILCGEVWEGELLNRRKDGTLFWESEMISAVRSEAGTITHFVAVKTDVTERKRAEHEVAMLNVELERRVVERTRQLEVANRELQSFSYSISHDLRAPLRAIHGFACAIEEEGGACGDGLVRDYLQRIQAAATRMGELIDELHELGRIGQTEIIAQPTDLSVMAGEILAALSHREPERKVEIDITPDVVVTGDPRLLRIALSNLLGNAWKFSAERDVAHIAFGCTARDGRRVLTVRDDGAGFDMSYAEKLFRPFERLHVAGRFPGSGIGLPIVKRIVELHNGYIWAESTPGEGAAFHVELPECSPARGGWASPEASDPFGPVRIHG